MTTLLALAVLATAEPSPYTYKPVVGQKAVYTVRYTIGHGSKIGAIGETLTTEVLSVEPDGTAQVRFSFSDVGTTGVTRNQPFDTDERTVFIDKYGRFRDPANLTGQIQLLAVAFALPVAELGEKSWLAYLDPLDHSVPGMEIEGSVKSRNGSRLVLVSRSKARVEGQLFWRETTFDSETGQVLAVRLRSDLNGNPAVQMVIDRKDVKR